MFKHCNIERPPHTICYFSKYTYYLPPSTPFNFYNPHPHLFLAFALVLSLKGKGMLAKESSQVTALRYSTMLSSSSLALSLSLSTDTTLTILTISIFHKVTTASY